ncbi:MAG: hypothetical protein IJZ74_01685 [Clostridia bacterium]|nr:hypothetical protein [Clostridia bacterium]
MILFCIFLTFGAINAILLQAKNVRESAQLVCFPRSLLRTGVGLCAATTALAWFFPRMWVIALAVLAEVPVLLWRNCRILWGKRTFSISGVTGLNWTFSYAEVTSLRGPFLRIGWRVWLLWPGTENRAAFIGHLRQAMAVSARDARYRRTPPPRQPENKFTRTRLCSYLIWITFCAFLLLAGNRPITADTGRFYEVTLRSARQVNNDVRMDFGYHDIFEISCTEATAPLLDPAAEGQSFTVQAIHHTGRRTRDRYEIVAISGADGAVYRTWEESEALRQENKPARITLLLLFSLFPFLLDTGSLKHRRPR